VSSRLYPWNEAAGWAAKNTQGPIGLRETVLRVLAMDLRERQRQASRLQVSPSLETLVARWMIGQPEDFATLRLLVKKWAI
jgi:hypothetical protein